MTDAGGVYHLTLTISRATYSTACWVQGLLGGRVMYGAAICRRG